MPPNPGRHWRRGRRHRADGPHKCTSSLSALSGSSLIRPRRCVDSSRPAADFVPDLRSGEIGAKSPAGPAFRFRPLGRGGRLPKNWPGIPRERLSADRSDPGDARAVQSPPSQTIACQCEHTATVCIFRHVSLQTGGSPGAAGTGGESLYHAAETEDYQFTSAAFPSSPTTKGGTAASETADGKAVSWAAGNLRSAQGSRDGRK